jgi:TatD DNase family protein
VIDFHAHLDLYSDPASVVREIDRLQMYVLSVTTTPSAWPHTSEIGQKASRVRTALGLHPQLAHLRYTELSLFDELFEKAKYIGEIGLDGGPEFRQHWERQIEVFDHILRRCARAGGRTMSIHSRRATSAVLKRLAAHPGAGVPILHWFSGTQPELNRAIKQGCWFSIGPAMLAGQKGREISAAIPRDRVLTETDGPFAQVDGRSAMPWDTQLAVDGLAELWGVSSVEVEAQLQNNLRSLGRPSEHTVDVANSAA